MNSTELQERLLDFAANVGRQIDDLPETRLGKHIAEQLAQRNGRITELRRSLRRRKPRGFHPQTADLLERTM